MRLLLKNARIYDTTSHSFSAGELFIADGRVAHPDGEADSTVDLGGKLVIPGLIDIHTHGRAGYDFCTADEAGLDALRASYAGCGVTTLFPTLASAPPDVWETAIRRIGSNSGKTPGAVFAGIHLEGRWINPGKRGVHAPELISPPDAAELERMARLAGTPLHVTYAPELDIDGSFAAAATRLGVTLAAGHTAADYETARLAERRGVNCFSHTFNAMPPLHHREGGAVAAALCGDSFCELICDGHHIAPHMVGLMWKCVGRDRLVLVSDSLEGAGMPDGEYNIAGVRVSVKDGVALTPDGTLGGSTLGLFDALINLIDFCGITLEEALPAATSNPARAVGIYSDVGSLDVGKRADALILGDNGRKYTLDGVIVGGGFIIGNL